MRVAAKILERAAGAVAAVALAGILLFVSLQVVFRLILNQPLPWPEELSRILFIYLVFIGAAEASMARTHIAVDLVDTFGLSPRVDRILGLFRNVAMLVVLGVIIVGAWRMAPIVHGMRLPATGLTMSKMVLPVLVGSALMALATFLNVIMDVRHRPGAGSERR